MGKTMKSINSIIISTGILLSMILTTAVEANSQFGGNSTYQMVCMNGVETKIESDGTGVKIESDGTGNKIESDGTGSKIESDGTGSKIESDGTGVKIESDGTGNKKFCMIIKK
jgi:hypothetical protein